MKSERLEVIRLRHNIGRRLTGAEAQVKQAQREADQLRPALAEQGQHTWAQYWQALERRDKHDEARRRLHVAALVLNYHSWRQEAPKLTANLLARGILQEPCDYCLKCRD